VKEHFPGGFPKATLCSDRWPAHLNTPARQHQLCLVHLIRELNYLEALEKQTFSIELRELFQETISEKKKDRVYQFEEQKPQALEERLNLLLVQNISKDKSPKTATLQRSLIKHRSSIFPFLYEEKLSADNNASERSIRNLKVKMKVSGLFKTGQSVYAVLKSITETIKKKGQSIFQAFCLLANSEYHLMDTE
jgi:transposase